VTVIVVKMPYGFMKPSKYLGRWSKITTLKAQVLTSIFFAQREFWAVDQFRVKSHCQNRPTR
jgi:hypothetical protein